MARRRSGRELGGGPRAAAVFGVLLAAMIGDGAAGPPDAEYDFVLTREYHNPDGFWKEVSKVNGEFPGPTIRVTNGGRLVVRVDNLSDRPVSLHWHGVEHTPEGLWYDGVSMGTQCAISPGGSMVYNFTVNQPPGVMMWHVHHFAGEADGLSGPFIIDPNGDEPTAADEHALDLAKDYDGEIVIDLMDWLHEDGEQVAQRMAGVPLDKYAPANAGVPFHSWGAPQAILINGRGDFHCTAENGMPDLTHSMCWPLTSPLLGDPEDVVVTGGSNQWSFTSGRRYLMRVVNTGTFCPFKFKLYNHTMVLVGVDGSPVEPIRVNDVRPSVGESYDVIIEATGTPGSSYAIEAGTAPGGLFQKALVVYDDGPAVELPPYRSAVLSAGIADWTDTVVSGALFHSAIPFPKDMRSLWPDRTIYIENYQLYDPADNRLTWPVNGNEFEYDPSGLPLLPLAKYGLLAGGPDQPDHNIFELKQGDVVDLVLVNHAETWVGEVGETVIHPWHLHGNKFWVLGYGPNRFNRTDPEHVALLDLEKPARRDMVVLSSPASVTTGDEVLGGPDVGAHCYIDDPRPECALLDRPLGWVVVRLKAERPGVFAFHCHHLWHYLSNMRAYIVVAPEEIPDMPEGLPQTCGNPDTWDTINSLAGLSDSPVV